MATIDQDVFDPTIVELPQIKLLGSVYELQETDGKRMQRVLEIQAELQAMDEDEDDVEAMSLVCRMIGESVAPVEVDNDTDIAAELFAAFKAGKHKVTTQMLGRTAMFIRQWQEDQATLGEG